MLRPKKSIYEVQNNPLEYELWQTEMERYEEYVQRLFTPACIGVTAPRSFDPEFVLDGFLAQPSLTLLAGDPKSGKTCLATALAVAVATGTTFAGCNTNQGPVLWLSLEEHSWERDQSLRHVDPNLYIEDLKNANGIKAMPLYTTYEPIKIDEPRSLDAVHKWVQATGARLIVVDPLHMAHSGRSLTDGWAARKTLQHLKDFATLTNTAIIVLHHMSRKNQTWHVAENAQLEATASNFITLTYEDKLDFSDNEQGTPEPRHSRLLTLESRGRGMFSNRTIYLRSEHPMHYEVATRQEPLPELDGGKCSELEIRILRLLQERAMNAQELVKTDSTLNIGSIYNALNSLLKAGFVKTIGYSRQGRRYALCYKMSE